MLSLLNVYAVVHAFTDHPLYNGERYRSGGAVTVEHGTKVRPLYVLEESSYAPDTLYMAQTVKEDGSAGIKIRLYEGDVTAVTIEGSTVTTNPAPAWAVNPFNLSTACLFIDEACSVIEGVTGLHTSGIPDYVNTADSILRESDE